MKKNVGGRRSVGKRGVVTQRPTLGGASKKTVRASKWTHFMDMHSGGGQKLDWPHIFIEAPQAEAERIFQNRFGRNPNRVTCTCCGNDYSISEEDSLEQATAYERGCAFAYFRPDAERREPPESPDAA